MTRWDFYVGVLFLALYMTLIVRWFIERHDRRDEVRFKNIAQDAKDARRTASVMVQNITPLRDEVSALGKDVRDHERRLTVLEPAA